MNLLILLVSILLLFSFSFAGFILYMHAKKKSVPDTGLVISLFFVNFLYIFGYAMELASQSIEWKLIFNHIQYMGLPFITPFWLMISIRFCKPCYRWKALTIALVMTIPAATMLLNLTHTMSSLLYSSYWTESWNGVEVVVYQKGVWYYIESLWHMILLAAALIIFARTYWRGDGIKKRQALIMLILSAFAFMLAVTTFFSTETAPIDFVVLLLSASSILLFATLFKYSLFDLVPLAHSQLFNGMDYPVLILADSMSVVKANDAAIRIFPILRQDRFLPLQSLFAEDERLVSKLMENEESLVEVILDAEKRFYSAKLSRLNIKQSAIKKDYGYLLVFSDVTSHINLVRDLELEASMDPLTGLLNRRVFFPMAERTIDQAAAAGETISLIMIDIDHYKRVNDEHGHQAGDCVLKDVSSIISSQIRESDIVARYGGEEFLILLPSTKTEDAKSVADRICNAVREHEFVINDQINHLTVSIGIASMMQPVSQRIDNLIYLADKALYDAKRKGRNRVCIRNEE